MKMNQIRGVRYTTSAYADAAIYAGFGGDCVNGKKGTARAKSGAKHHLRSRVRCKENAAMKKEIKMLSI